MTNAVNWFEIPVENFERAKGFYTTILETEITDMPMEDAQYGVFPYDEKNQRVGGAIVQMEQLKPSADGAVVYLNAGDDLSGPLGRVEAAGGKVLLPKMAVGENGFIAHFLDTEGNRVALHSMN